MSINQTTKGYYIKSTEGTIYARNIPTKALAKQMLKQINYSREAV